MINFRSIFADDDDDDDNIEDTLGISTKPAVNGDTVKKPAERQSTVDEVQQFIPLIIIICSVLYAFFSKLLDSGR